MLFLWTNRNTERSLLCSQSDFPWDCNSARSVALAGRELIISQVMGPSQYELCVSSEKHSIKGSPISVLVCTNCGNIQFFTDPQDFKRD